MKRVVYAILYSGNLAYNILKSALNVTIICVKGGIDPTVVEVKTRLRRPISHFFLANSITLTPGTVTIDVDSERQVLKVAAITPTDPKDIIPFESLIGGMFE